MGFLDFLTKKNEKKMKKKLKSKISSINSDKDIKKTIELENLRDEFHEILFNINIEKSRTKKKKLISKARKIAEKIPEYSGWPKASKFWDVEAIAWIVNIPKMVRQDIRKQIKKTIPKGENLALGCGSYPYVKKSVLVDFSEEMLNSAPPDFRDRVLFDLNKGNLPFRSYSFDSVTMVFIVNYIKDLKYMLSEAKRVLKQQGKLIIVQSAKPISHFYRIKEKKQWTPKQIKSMLTRLKMKNKSYEHTIGRTRLIFIEAVKT